MMRIKVTKDHIEKATRNHSLRCPIQIALTKAVPGKWIVYPNATIFEGNDTMIAIENGARVTDWIRNFDLRLNVKPIDLELDMKARTLRAVGG